jgi:DNA mismatch repair protein MutL
VQVPDFRFLGELRGRFALFESEDGLVLFYPRAARERILYERWLGTAARAAESQGLLVPQVFEPGPREANLLLDHRDLFQKAGFELGDFGSGSIRLDSVPAFLSDEAPDRLLVETLADLEDGGRGTARFALEKLAAALARRAAVREAPQPGEACRLLEQLFQCELPYCAADGRPVLTEFSMSELERRFAK